MTVIAGVKTEREGIVLVSDSQISWGYKKEDMGTKVFVLGHDDWIMGGAGSSRSDQVIQYYTTWPHYHPEDGEVEKFGVTVLVPCIIDAAEQGGVLLKDKTGYRETEGTFMFGFADVLMTVETDFSVVVHDHRGAIGSGSLQALGYLDAIGPPFRRKHAIDAARAATLTGDGVGGKLWVVSTKTLTIEEVE